jgi:predicted ArsR family transcriptional regulator
MKITAKQVAERLDVSYVVASGLMSHLVSAGRAKVAEKIFHQSGKGKPTRVYEVDQNVMISFGDDIFSDAA